MAVTGKASLSFYVIALLAQGATTATSLKVQEHTYHDTDYNASRASAHTQRVSTCYGVADQSVNQYVTLTVNGASVQVWCDFTTDPGRVWRVGLFPYGGTDVWSSAQNFRDFCAARSFADAGKGVAEHVESWLVQKRMAWDTGSSITTSAGHGPHLAMPMFGTPPYSLYTGTTSVLASLPANRGHDRCDGSATQQLCGMWFGSSVAWNHWTANDFEYPDPEDWGDHYGRLNEELISCMFLDEDDGMGNGVSSSAVGDPHLQNIYGERFDLMRPGKSVLISIPRGQPAGGALLAVEADARQLAGDCNDMYFVKMNITGAWADTVQAGGIAFDAQGARDELPKWMKFGPVELKVVHGRTNKGTKYLNFYVKHLGKTGFAVGGLLGEDDHSEVAIPAEGCQKKLDLQRQANSNGKDTPASVAIAISE